MARKEGIMPDHHFRGRQAAALQASFDLLSSTMLPLPLRDVPGSTRAVVPLLVCAVAGQR